ncbi:MAG: MaoC family dehydratase N-terminal domain-containing protein [Acidimicrobiales bacterium]
MASNEIPADVQSLIGFTRSITDAVTARDIRHFAQAIGDDDPLYSDEQHGLTTRYGSMIAPPLFGQTFAFADLPVAEMPPDLSPSEADVPVPAERTVGGSSEYEFFQPIRPGDVITRTSELKSVTKKVGSSGDLYLVLVETRFVNQDGVLVAREEATYVKK